MAKNINNTLDRARELLRDKYPKGQLPAGTQSLTKAKEMLKPKGSLDVYIIFDTTGSMSSYINQVKENIAEVTSALLNGESDIKLSINGVGDHCDGEDVMQMYALTGKPEEAQGTIENIVMTDGGDEPEAYECMAVAMSKRLSEESKGRKRAVVFVADSVPHGMVDAPCPFNVDYKSAFEAMKAVCDGFYLVGCNPQTYSHQRELIDAKRKDREQFISLGSMVEILPSLLVALAKKVESEKAMADYLNALELKDSDKSAKVRGLLASGG